MAVRRRKKRVARKSPAAPRRRKRRVARKNPAAPRRRRRRVARKNPAAPRRRRRRVRRNPARKTSRRSTAARRAAARRTARKLKRVRAGYKRAGKRSARRRVGRARAAALSVKLAAQRGKLSGPARKLARQYGLLRVNPSLSFGAALKDAVGVLPHVGVGIGAAVAIGWVGNKIAPKLEARGGLLEKVAKPGTTMLLTVAAYMGLRMTKMQKYSMPTLVAGMTLAVFQAMQKISMGGETLAAKVGLPGLGEYVALSGYPDPNLMVGGRDIKLNGAVGEYVADPAIGEYVAIGSGIFDGSSLGDVSQMGYGREGSRGLSTIPRVEDFVPAMSDADSGVLAGSIFDDA